MQASFTVSAVEFKKAFKRVLPFVDVSGAARWNMAMVCIQCNKDGVKFIATDGTVLAVQQVLSRPEFVDMSDETKLEACVFVHVLQAAVSLCKNCSQLKFTFRQEEGSSSIEIDTGGNSHSAVKLTESQEYICKFAPWEKLLASCDKPEIFKLTKREFLRVIEEDGILSKHKDSLGSKTVYNGVENGDRVDLTLTQNEANFCVSLHEELLAKAVSQFPASGEISVGIAGPNSPLILQHPEGLCVVVHCVIA